VKAVIDTIIPNKQASLKNKFFVRFIAMRHNTNIIQSGVAPKGTHGKSRVDTSYQCMLMAGLGIGTRIFLG
jgi:hypothetical protein